jgi:putative sterol carrier protein
VLTDPDVNFAGRLRTGSLTDIRQVSAAEAATAKVRLHMSGDDLVRLVAGELKMASAWASGQVKIEAGVLDLVKLRSIL